MRALKLHRGTAFAKRTALYAVAIVDAHVATNLNHRLDVTAKTVRPPSQPLLAPDDVLQS